MSDTKKEDLTEARIRDAMAAIREKIVRPVTVHRKLVYVYAPSSPRADAAKQWKGEPNAD